MYRLRLADDTDIEWLLVELKKFSNFYGMEKYKLFDDETHCRSTLEMLIQRHLFVVATYNDPGTDNEVGVGFICGFYINHHFNPKIKMMSEQFWWVAEEHRRSLVGAKLLRMFIDISKENVDVISLSLLSNSPVKEESFIKLGFKMTEKSFIMEV
jgi:Acetyltransferase (GNAT) family